MKMTISKCGVEVNEMEHCSECEEEFNVTVSFVVKRPDDKYRNSINLCINCMKKAVYYLESFDCIEFYGAGK